MMIPNAAEAIVPAEKLTGYLLAFNHPQGGAKARFFRAHGYSEHNLEILVSDLKLVAQRGEVQREQSRYGAKYIATGDVETPRDTTVRLRTIWIIEANETQSRFVTAYPV